MYLFPKTTALKYCLIFGSRIIYFALEGLLGQLEQSFQVTLAKEYMWAEHEEWHLKDGQSHQLQAQVC